MATKSKRHIHKYYRASVGDDKVWACALSTCNHHMPSHYSSLVEGKASICWKCGEMMTLNTINMKEDKPICNECNPMMTAVIEMTDPSQIRVNQAEQRLEKMESEKSESKKNCKYCGKEFTTTNERKMNCNNQECVRKMFNEI